MAATEHVTDSTVVPPPGSGMVAAIMGFAVGFGGVIAALAALKLSESMSNLSAHRNGKTAKLSDAAPPADFVASSYSNLKDVAPFLGLLIAIGGIAVEGLDKLTSIENSIARIETTIKQMEKENTRRFDEQNKRLEEQSRILSAINQQIFSLALNHVFRSGV